LTWVPGRAYHYFMIENIGSLFKEAKAAPRGKTSSYA